jgi:oligosaccharyltransferase complex subunit beta
VRSFFYLDFQLKELQVILYLFQKELAKALSRWCFKLSGVLRVINVHHSLESDPKTPPPPFYTIKDEVVYTIDIEEFKDGKWVPYQANDVQLEFVRIDPFVRMTMVPKNGKFVAKFTIPDVYGVYQFKVSVLKP